MARRRLLAVLSLITAGVLLVGTAPQASAEVGRVYLRNSSSTTIKIACDYGGPLKSLAPGQNSQQAGKCTAKVNDTDQLYVSQSKCMRYRGPRVKDGYYKITSGVRLKIHDLANVQVYNWANSNCIGRPYYTTR